jgi:hypothetical protein
MSVISSLHEGRAGCMRCVSASMWARAASSTGSSPWLFSTGVDQSWLAGR